MTDKTIGKKAVVIGAGMSGLAQPEHSPTTSNRCSFLSATD